MALQDTRDLLEYDLSMMLAAERQILEMLPLLAKESDDAVLRNGFAHHMTQTRQQIENLERCCNLLNFQPLPTTCPITAGIQQAHDMFAQQNPSPTVQVLFDLGAATKTEYFEIACYRGLIAKASLMNKPEVVTLLEQNLAQEEEMARQLEALAPLEARKAMTSAGQNGADADDEEDEGGDSHAPRNGSRTIGEGNQTGNDLDPPTTLRHPTEQRLEEAGISPSAAQLQREEAGDER